LLDDLEDLFQLKAQDKQLQLIFECTPDVPQYLRTDEVKLRQVLINLLNNAIKFTQEGGVSVKVQLQPSGKEKVLSL
ncbi:MAG TPA: hybrid sensor histidine kinase/response regulator, partial [Cyanobacteria bacterium UBA9273]|nr:hybrid sensor histidine kinase/response regulator [Cyanobacteria bacterium UBA9273]